MQEPARQVALVVSDPVKLVVTGYVQRSEILNLSKATFAFEGYVVKFKIALLNWLGAASAALTIAGKDARLHRGA